MLAIIAAMDIDLYLVDIDIAPFYMAPSNIMSLSNCLWVSPMAHRVSASSSAVFTD
jgi:hypothetical protein